MAGYAPSKAASTDKSAIAATVAQNAAMDIGSRQITSVAAGTNDSDAANVAQLKAVENLATSGWNVADSTGTKANIGPTGKVTFNGDSNVTVTAGGAQDAGTVGVQLNKNLDLSSSGSLTVGNSLLNNTGLTITGGPSVTTSGIDAGSKKITNVAAGTAGTDGVNVSQLTSATTNPLTFAGNTGSVTKKLGETLVIKGVGSTAGTYSGNNIKTDVDASGNLNVSMADSPKFGNVTVNDGGSGKITGLTAGTADTDAVNVSQLKNATVNAAHYYSVNDGGTTGANYNNDGATGVNAIAAGVRANASGTSSIAIGDSSSAVGGNSIAIGIANTSQNGGIGLGSYNVAADTSSIAVGNHTTANAKFAVSFGSNAFTQNEGDMALGSSVTATGGNSVAIGSWANASGENAIANGPGASAKGLSSTAIGNNTLAAGDQSTAIGVMAHAADKNSTAIGDYSSATGSNSLAMGYGATTYNANDVALGAGSVTDAAVGTASTTIAGTTYNFAGTAPTSTVSVGSVGNERTITNVAAGRLSADSTDAVNGSQLFASNQAIDNLNINVDNLDKGAVKYDVNPDGTVNYDSVTLAGGDNGTKITNVAAGDVSADSTDAINGSQLFETNTNVTNLGNTINNFAGDQTAEYTEINGRGIRYVRTNDTGLDLADSSAQGQGSTAVGYNATSIGESSLALGREAKANNKDDVALGADSVTDAAVGTASTTIAGTTYNFAGFDPLSTVSVGSKGKERTITNVAAGRLSADSTDAVNGSQLFATNSAIDSINNNIDVLDKGSVKYDVNSDGTVNYNHITLAGGDAGTTISNVAAGEKGTDAVNVDQLNDTVAASKTHYYSVNDGGVQGGNFANDGATGNNSLAAGVNAKASTDGGVALGSDSVASVEAGVKGYTPASASAEQVDAIDATTSTRGAVSVGDADNGIFRQITGVAAGSADSDAVNVAQLKGAIGSATANAVSYDNSTHNSVTLNGDTYNSETKQGGTTITNVAAGVNDSDAVNMAQLNQTNTTVNNVTEGKDGMFQVNNTSNLPKPKPTGKDSTAGGAGAVASADNSTAIGSNAKATHNNSVAIGANSATDRDNSVSVGSAGAERQITHVAAGTADTDAVNLAQLNKATGDINNSINQVYSDLKHDLNKQDDILSAGIAGALAAATLPQPYVPGASMASVGAGNYRGQQALAIGVSRISDNGKWVTKLSANTDTQGEFGVSVGVGYQW
ncbi:YadA family autotransporter adhesin [Pseudomonas nicosulfuronedens]|nr:YadA-like family protein [Pseudomonas nicosulfuronedens]